MNNIIILQHQITLCFSPFNLTVQSGHQFCPKSENLVFKQDYFFPTFLLLIKARRCDKKNRNIFSQGPIIHSGVFACPHFKSDIRKDNRRSHVKLDNILFYFFKKEKMK